MRILGLGSLETLSHSHESREVRGGGKPHQLLGTMRVSTAAMTLCLLLSAATARAQEAYPIPPQQLTQILEQVFAVRSETIPDSARFDACSLSAALGDDPAVATRFLPWVRERLVGPSGPGCERAAAPRPRMQTLWKLRRIEVEHGYRVIVRATAYTPLGNHYEAWEVVRDPRPGPDPYWGVRDVVLSDFIRSEQGLVVPPPPATRN